MKTISILAGVLLFTAAMFAESNIPVGTVIPVELNSSINAKNAKPGQIVTARVAQDVPLYNGMKIKAGAKVMGQVVPAASQGNSGTIALRFDKVELSGQMSPVVTDLRAMASPLEVDAAQTQVSGDDRGSTPAWSQTVTQVGGSDVVYRETGVVDDGLETIGKSVYAGDWGVLTPVAQNDRCRGAIAGNDNPQALWVFSHDACGVYGYDATIIHAGRSNPQGQIVLASTSSDLKLFRGTALLLRVNGSGAALSQNDVSSK